MVGPGRGAQDGPANSPRLAQGPERPERESRAKRGGTAWTRDRRSVTPGTGEGPVGASAQLSLLRGKNQNLPLWERCGWRVWVWRCLKNPV